MAGTSSTSFKLALFGVLLITVLAPTFARTSRESNIIKEVIAEQEAALKVLNGGYNSPLEHVEIIMKPKNPITKLGSCVEADGSCGPLFPCCYGLTCSFDLDQFRFKCW